MMSAYEEIIKNITDQRTACWYFRATHLRENTIITEKDKNKNSQKK